jgi:rhodanese-related sulfurtransferase/predicted MFS family arabinose efflux permease
MTVIMKIDLVGPKSRGLAVGLNEFAGYLAVGITAFLTGYIAERYGLRPAPIYLGVAYAILGTVLSILLVHDTRGHVHLEIKSSQQATSRNFWDIFTLTSFRDRNLFAASQAGLVNNLNDGMSWGIFRLFFAAFGLGVERIGILKAVYPATWGILQVATGPLSDRWGRKGLIVVGMWVQAAALLLTALTRHFEYWLVGSLLLGIGTAMVYPSLIAAVSDASHPTWRARSLSVYRFWRDLGYAIGALSAGMIADFFGMAWAIGAIAALTFASGVVVALLMRELSPGTSNSQTLPRRTNMSNPNGDPKFMEPGELHERLKRGEELIVIDVRSAEEFDSGHIESAINIPTNQLAARSGEFRTNATIVTVCNSGGARSCGAAEQLRSLGYNSALPLRGGVRGWQDDHD